MTDLESKIQRLLDLLEEQNVGYQKAIHLCEQIEKTLQDLLDAR